MTYRFSVFATSLLLSLLAALSCTDEGALPTAPVPLEVSDEFSATTAITYGQTIAASLSTPTEVDVYTFFGDAGDPVFVMMTGATTAMDPQVELFDPSGTRLASQGTATEAILRVTLPVTGIYTIHALEWGQADAGPYGLHLQRMVNPVGAVPIAYGETIAGSLSPAGDADVYVFTGQAGDPIFAMNSAGTVAMDPFLDLYDAQGVRLTTAASATEAIIQLTLPADGQYTLMARESNGGDTGPYGVHLQHRTNPVGAQPIAYGETKSGSLSPGGDADAWTFTGQAGDVIFAMNTAGTVAMDPILDLYDAQGTRLASAYTATEAIIRLTLPTDGQYMLLARESNAADTGPYGLYLQRMNGPASGESIAYGQTLARALSPGGDADLYTFTGNGGDQIRVQVVENVQLAPVIELYDAAGQRLASAGGVSVINLDHTLPGTGDYHILVYEQNAADTGPYSVSLNLTAAPDLQYGQTIAASLSTPTEVDVYTFFGDAGDPVFVMMTGATTAMDPQVELFDPSGTRLASQGTATEAILRVTLPVTGIYTIHALEWGQADAGPYGLHLQRMVNPVGAVPIAYGETIAGSLSPAGDADVYVFTGQAGDPIFAMNSAGTVAMDPFLDLYDAQGVRLTTAASATEAIIQLTLPADGQYTLMARESNGGDTGPYGVHLQHRTNPVGAQPIAYGETKSGSLSPGGDADAWTFTGQAGDVIFAMNTAGTVAMDPILDLYDAQGTRLASAYTATEAIIRLTLPTDGQYMLLARESNAADTGPYGLYLQRMNGPASGESIAYGQTLARALSPGGDADLYTFTGNGGDQIRVQVVENVQLAPVIELYDAAGQRLASAGGVSVINLDHTLPGTGDYHILVYEQNAADTGPYSVSLTLTGASVPTATLVSMTPTTATFQGTWSGTAPFEWDARPINRANSPRQGGSTNGTVVAFTMNRQAAAYPGTFKVWETAGGYALLGTGSFTVPALPPPPQFTLTVQGAGTGDGSVTGSGISCQISGGSTSGTCAQDLNDGTSVTLVATAISGSAFVGWSGDCSGTGSCQVTMSQARTVTATFNAVPPPPPTTVTLISTTATTATFQADWGGNAPYAWDARPVNRAHSPKQFGSTNNTTVTFTLTRQTFTYPATFKVWETAGGYVLIGTVNFTVP